MSTLIVTGLKAADREVHLSPLTLLCGPTGCGKSTVADGLRFLALGWIPALGRTEAATAQLLRDREAVVRLELDDGKWVERRLFRKSKGGFGTSCQCSWLAEGATAEEHEVAISSLFGGDSRVVEECLDVRELLKLSGAQRAARLQQLLEAGAATDDLMLSIARLTMQKLANVADAHMPESHLSLRPLIPGYAANSECTGQYRALKAAIPLLKGKVEEVGLAGAAGWVNERKRSAATELRDKRAARDEMQPRHDALPVGAPETIAQLEAERSRCEREMGAYEERLSEVERRRVALAAAARQLSTAETALHAARAEREGCEQACADLDAKRIRLVEIEEQLATLQPPLMEDDSAAAQLEATATARQKEAEEVILPEIADLVRLSDGVEDLRGQVDRIRQSPWSEVREIADRIVRRSTGHSERIKALLADAARLMELAGLHGGDDGAVCVQLVAAEKELERVRALVPERTRERAEAMQRRDDLLRQMRAAREQAAAVRQGVRERFHVERAGYLDRKRALEQERDGLRAAIAALDARDQRTAEHLAQTAAAVAAARQRLSDLGEAPVDDAATDLSAALRRVTEQLATLTSARARREEYAALLAGIERAEAEHVVFVALEEAIKRVRAREVHGASGPLLTHMARFLAAAGRPEIPYVEVDRGACEVGWRDTAARRISVAAMSGGEFALFTTALAVAVIGLYGAPLRVLMAEAAECDNATAAGLLRGIEAVGALLTHAIVNRPAAPAASAAWAVIAPNGAERAAA